MFDGGGGIGLICMASLFSPIIFLIAFFFVENRTKRNQYSPFSFFSFPIAVVITVLGVFLLAVIIGVLLGL